MKRLLPLLLVGCGGTLGHPSAPTIRSTFDTDVEGWRIDGFNTDNHDYSIGQITPVVAIFDPSGAAMREETFYGGTDYFVAPADYLGDLSAYAHGTLRYTIRDEYVDEPFDAPLVLLDGAGARWRYDGTTTAGLTTTPFLIPFEGNAGWSRLEGTASFAEALVGVTALQLRGEFSSEIDRSWIDDVALSP
ncbi:MAG: laminin B domain-containing protein [Polyangia bacterium]